MSLWMNNCFIPWRPSLHNFPKMFPSKTQSQQTCLKGYLIAFNTGYSGLSKCIDEQWCWGDTSIYYILCVDISVIKLWLEMIPVKWYDIISMQWNDIISLHGLNKSNQIDCNNLVGPIGLHIIF